jgi:uncharacterized protein (DUF1330 family)
MAMKSNHKIAAAVIASFVLGAGAVSVLHAQAKIPAYVVAEIDVKDQDGYTKDFLPKAQANIKEMGGKYLAGGFNKATVLSGAKPPNRVVLLQFPDMDAVKASTAKSRGLRPTLAINTPASARSGSRASSRSDNADGGGLRRRPAASRLLDCHLRRY